jgi:hypothetical protein
LICPDDSVALIVNDPKAIPETVRCWRQEEDGPVAEEIRTDSLERHEFYVLNERQHRPVSQYKASTRNLQRI